MRKGDRGKVKPAKTRARMMTAILSAFAATTGTNKGRRMEGYVLPARERRSKEQHAALIAAAQAKRARRAVIAAANFRKCLANNYYKLRWQQ